MVAKNSAPSPREVRGRMNIDEKLKAMREAKCSIKECEENQAIFNSMPSPISPDVQEVFPFCMKHFEQIQMRELDTFTLKNGYVYGFQKSKKEVA